MNGDAYRLQAEIEKLKDENDELKCQLASIQKAQEIRATSICSLQSEVNRLKALDSVTMKAYNANLAEMARMRDDLDDFKRQLSAAVNVKHTKRA